MYKGVAPSFTALEKRGPFCVSVSPRLEIDPHAHVQLHLRQVPRLDGVEKRLHVGFALAFEGAVHVRPRLLQHRPAHHQVAFIAVAAAFPRRLRLLLESRHRAREAPALRGQVGQDGGLQARLLRRCQRHRSRKMWAMATMMPVPAASP